MDSIAGAKCSAEAMVLAEELLASASLLMQQSAALCVLSNRSTPHATDHRDERCKRVIYGIRLLEVLSRVEQVETHLVLSDSAKLNIAIETDRSAKRFRFWQMRSTPTGILRRDWQAARLKLTV